MSDPTPAQVRSGRRGVWLAFAAASVGMGLGFGFSVDDAWIPVRVAYHLAHGFGYRFNAEGAIVDAVTPLGWAHLLAPAAWFGEQAAMNFARGTGVVAYLLASCKIGAWVGRTGGRLFPLLGLGLVPTLAVYPSTGMETGLVMGLLTYGVLASGIGRACLGIAVGMRPELAAFVFAWALGQGICRCSARVFWESMVLGGFGLPLVLGLRFFLFGSPSPLALLAKPADLASGLSYVFGVLAFSGPFWLWVGPGYRRLPHQARVFVVATLAHLVALALVGGDWMALYRLAAPVLPVVLMVGCHLAQARGWLANVLPCVGAIAAIGVLGYHVLLPARHIVEQRQRLITEARPMLAGRHAVATVDVGWVGAASRAEILDLAGVTEPEVARLSGGHTSKRIPFELLERRRVDTFVLLLKPGANLVTPFWQSAFARVVETRVAQLLRVSPCRIDHTLELAFTSQRYVIVRCDNLSPPQREELWGE